MSSKFYEKYWSSDNERLNDFDLKWPKLKVYLPSGGNAVVLDFGCGKGDIISEMMKINSQARYIGLDVSEKALENAKRRLPNADFRKIEDGGELPLKNGEVDFIFSSEVIEHVYDTENAVREMDRILRPGGRALITTPYHGFLKNLAIVLFGFNRHFNPVGAHVRFFSKRSLRKLLEKNGLNVLKFGFYGRFYPFSKSMYVLAEKKI